ncbi:MAG: HD domain-containing phosphohydrolase [Tuberibacillus sp.]
MRRVKPSLLTEGQILGQDVYKDHRIVYNKGSVLTDGMIQNISNWRKTPVVIDEPNLHADSVNSHSTTPNKEQLTKLFYERLIHIGQEKRYGFALIEESTYLWLENLFSHMLSNQKVYSLFKRLESWNPYSIDHSIDVFVLGALLGRKLGIKRVKQFALGCLLHDVGKLEIPSYILDKKSKLTQTEYHLVQNHAIMGASALKDFGFDSRIVKLARSHHERLNGSGYPDGLSGNQIDLDLQIISIVDVYSALTLPRTYRVPMESPEALELILKDSAAFSQEVLFTFIQMLNIYPPEAEVRLSNGQIGTTVYQPHWKTNVPMITIHDTGECVRLPTNLSLVVTEMLGWNSLRIDQTLKKHWQSFIKNLKEGNKKKALESFEILADGKRVEDIYIDIIEKAVKEIERSKANKEEIETSRRVALDILDQKLVDFAPSYQTASRNSVIVTAYDEQCLLPTKILHDMLFVNGWKTYYLSLQTNENRLKRIIEKNDATHVAFYVPTESHSITVNIIIKGLLEHFPNLSIIIYGESAHLIESNVNIKAPSMRILLNKIKSVDEEISA